MSEKLAIEILKQATLETTIGACEKCPRKDKNKTCIGCLNEAKEKILLEVERLNKELEFEKLKNKEVREYIEHENFKRNILLGFSEKKYTRNILNKILQMLDKENK